MTTNDATLTKPTEPSFFNRREVRQAIYQIALVFGLIALFYMIITNAAENLRRQNIASGTDFLGRVSGFDISQTLIDYSNTSTYGRAFMVGLWNTVLVAVVGIVLATILGFTAGIARLSSNWLVAKIATLYVEVARNCPLLLQLFLWYFGVLKTLPGVFKQDAAGNFIMNADGTRATGSLELPGGLLLNNRGLIMPKPEFLAGSSAVLWSILAAVLLAIGVAFWARRRQMATGQPFPVFWSSLALIIGLPVVVFLLTGRPISLEYPTLGRFNLSGGMVIGPEFVALLLGLTVYTGAYIAEIVRSGILAVPNGQKEAARAMGLQPGQTMRLVVIPQAARVIIPPLTSQYLNLTKNSSLGIAIAYPDLVSVGGTILNQTGQAVVIVLMWMGVYLTLSLVTSIFMNWFNARMALVER
ncbi:MAG: amino acid ABC transporter permease [Hyphomicrobiaceae bacterium]